jgi:hypothetical protein
MAHVHFIAAYIEKQILPKKIKLEWGQDISLNTNVRNLKLDFEKQHLTRKIVAIYICFPNDSSYFSDKSTRFTIQLLKQIVIFWKTEGKEPETASNKRQQDDTFKGTRNKKSKSGKSGNWEKTELIRITAA